MSHICADTQSLEEVQRRGDEEEGPYPDPPRLAKQNRVRAPMPIANLNKLRRRLFVEGGEDPRAMLAREQPQAL